MKKILAIGLVIGVLLGGLAGYLIFHKSANLGTDITYSGSGGSMETYNLLVSILGDLQKVRAPLAGLLDGSGAISSTGLAANGISTSSAVGVSITVTGATKGDYVLLGLATSTSYVDANAIVSDTNTVTVNLHNVSSSDSTFATSTAYVLVLPRASFDAAAALGTATTSTP